MYYISSFVSVSFQRLCWCPSAHLSNHFPEYRKIPKISPRAYIFQGPFWGAYFWSGLHTEGNLRFKIYRFCFVLLCSKFKPQGGLYLEGRFNFRFFCVTSLGGLIFGGAYTWRSLFSEFYGISRMKNCIDLNRSEGFIYLPPFISRILDLIYCRVLIAWQWTWHTPPWQEEKVNTGGGYFHDRAAPDSLGNSDETHVKRAASS